MGIRNWFKAPTTTCDATVIPEDAMTAHMPCAADVMPLDRLSDPVFSEGVMGPGCGLIPSDEALVAPFDGTVTAIAKTKHAIGLTSSSGIEALIHIGMDTVSMNGEGFETFVSVGDHVRCGERIMTFSRVAIERAGFTLDSAMVITNGASFEAVELLATGALARSVPVLRVG